MMGEQMIGHNACAAIARHFVGHGVNNRLGVIGIDERQFCFLTTSKTRVWKRYPWRHISHWRYPFCL